MTEKKNLGRYKLAALLGTVIMAIGSFMACLCVDPVPVNIGNILLLVSIAVSVYGYSFWQP